MSKVIEESQGVVEVKVKPGEPVKFTIATIDPAWRQIIGYLVAPEPDPGITRVSRWVTDVASKLPDEYQRDDLDDYRRAIQSGLDEVRNIYLDVTDSNHIPTEVRGNNWFAWLRSVERIDECDPKRPMRLVAAYRAIVDPKGGAR